MGVSWQMPFIHVLSFNCRRHLAFYLSPIVGHELSLPGLRTTILFLTKSGMRFRHCSSLISLGIVKTVANACAQHAFIPLQYILYMYEICVACEKRGPLFGTRFKRFLN